MYKPKVYGETDVGRKRDHNEDAFLIDEDLQLYLVADGMGGHAAGEVASATAIKVIKAEFAKHKKIVRSYGSDTKEETRNQVLDFVEKTVLKACAAIYKLGQSDKQRRGMGTTLSMMLISGTSAFIAHVGDSRIYLIREGEVHQITVDHSLINEQLKHGAITKEEARKAKYKNVITRAVGIQEQVRVDTLHIDVLPFDQFLLSSDGFHDYLRSGDIEESIEAGEAKDLPRRCIDMANKRGGKDNITVVFVEIPGDEKDAAEELRQRLKTIRYAPLFKYLDYRELVNLMNMTWVRSVSGGETIIQEGVAGDELFLLVSGHVQVSKGGQEMAKLPQGSHFGEMALFENTPRTASVLALGPVRLLVIGRKQFYDYIRKDKASGIKLLWSFLQILTLRLRSTDERLMEVQDDLVCHDVEPEWILPDE